MFDASPRSELLALLAAVKDEPDDDTVRLVLADWLQEQDDEAERARGEWLRLVVRYPALSPDDFVERGAVWQRISRFWEHYHALWLGPLPAAGFRFPSSGTQGRGLLVSHIDGAQVVTSKAAELAGSEAYAWVSELHFNRLSGVQLARFAHAPLLDSLAGLTLSYCNPTSGSVAALALSPRISKLRSLVLDHVQANGAPLAASPHLACLRHLVLQHTHTGDEGFKALCDSPHLKELQSLTLVDDGRSTHTARAFAEATGLPALTELTLNGRDGIGSDGARILTASPNVGRLRRLNLSCNHIGDSGVECLCFSKHLGNLTQLDLSHNRLTNRGAVALAGATYLPVLHELNLQGNGIGGMGGCAIANSLHRATLQRLDLSGNPVGEKAAELLRGRFGTRVVLG